jgi:hypothetical protein
LIIVDYFLAQSKSFLVLDFSLYFVQVNLEI